MAIKKRVVAGSQPSGTSAPTGSLEKQKGGGWKTFNKHVMTGISHMIPILVSGGLILAFSQLIPYAILGVDPSMGITAALDTGKYIGMQEMMLRFAYLADSFGGTLFGFAIPMFAAFTANSIAGKTAFAAGFIGGLMATKPTPILSLVDGEWVGKAPVASGFIGALIIAFLAGYVVKLLNEKIKLSHNLLAFKSTFLVPVIGALFIMFSMYFIITPFGGYINEMIKSFLTSAGQFGEIGYAAALSLSTAVDLGGPINKAAGFVALGFTTEEVLPITARCISIVVPGIGLGLATILDKYLVGKRVFDKQFYPQGKTTILLSFMGISEGSIPFALECPKVIIPSYMIGALVGSVTAVVMGAVQWFPESAVWVWPLIENLPAYVIGIAVGSVVTAVLAILGRNHMIKTGKITVAQD